MVLVVLMFLLLGQTRVYCWVCALRTQTPDFSVLYIECVLCGGWLLVSPILLYKSYYMCGIWVGRFHWVYCYWFFFVISVGMLCRWDGKLSVGRYAWKGLLLSLLWDHNIYITTRYKEHIRHILWQNCCKYNLKAVLDVSNPEDVLRCNVNDRRKATTQAVTCCFLFIVAVLKVCCYRTAKLYLHAGEIDYKVMKGNVVSL
jgi:hypothetical protein